MQAEDLRALEGTDALRDCYEMAEAVASDERAIEELRAADVDPAKLERSVLLTINAAGQDSYRSKIPPKGGDFKRHKDNPVVLWAHDSKALPVARALTTYVDESKAIARTRSVAEFAPHDMNPMAESVFRMLKEKFLRGVSIGFRTIKAEPDPEDPNGYIVSRWELLEYSVLPIPSNPRALAEARSVGINVDPILAEAVRCLDGEAVRGWIKANAEEVWKILEGPRVRMISPGIEPNTIVVAAAPVVSTISVADARSAFAEAVRLIKAPQGQKDNK